MPLRSPRGPPSGAWMKPIIPEGLSWFIGRCDLTYPVPGCLAGASDRASPIPYADEYRPGEENTRRLKLFLVFSSYAAGASSLIEPPAFSTSPIAWRKPPATSRVSLVFKSHQRETERHPDYRRITPAALERCHIEIEPLRPAGPASIATDTANRNYVGSPVEKDVLEATAWEDAVDWQSGASKNVIATPPRISALDATAPSCGARTNTATYALCGSCSTIVVGILHWRVSG